MITVQQEEKIGKFLALLLIIPLVAIKDDMVKLYFLLPVLVVSVILTIRRYLRDKKAGKRLLKYYIALGFVLLSVVVACGFYIFMVR